MDIKLKNNYKTIICFILCAYLIATSIACIKDIDKHRSYLSKEKYTETEGFKQQMYNYINLVVQLNTTYKDFDTKSDDAKVSKSEIQEYKKTYDESLKKQESDLDDKYLDRIVSAEKDGNQTILNGIKEEKNKQLEIIKANSNISEESIKQEILKRKNRLYTENLNSVDSIAYFRFYMIDKKTNKVYTNLQNVGNISKYVEEKSLYCIKLVNGDDTSQGNNSGLEKFLYLENQYDSYFLVTNNQSVNSPIVNNIHYFNSIRDRLFKEIIILSISLPFGIGIYIFLLCKKRLQSNLLKNLKNSYNKIPLDIRCIIFYITVKVFNGYLKNVNIFKLPITFNQVIQLSIIALNVIYMLFALHLEIINFSQDGGLERQFEKSVAVRTWKAFKESISIKTIFVKVSLAFIMTIFFSISIIELFERSNLALKTALTVYIVGYIVITPVYVFSKISYLNRIIKGSNEIASGNFKYEIEAKGKSELTQLANNINNMKKGYESSVENQIKSERLKSELITNVSHDLKTPLTAIINYIDLLKNENITLEEKEEYLEVLDRKSHRLKLLIEDLFEVSKISSGAIELNIERVDVAAILKQAMGEFNEKISSSSLEFKINTSNSNIYVDLDGKRTWRVFENLLSNILKYSQPNTRVYIDMIDTEEKVTIIMKNISAYEMDFSPEEIFERFKRGDKSRKTEGNGLGLAIAKSIVELEKGTLNIEIDGDLFKVIVEFFK